MNGAFALSGNPGSPNGAIQSIVCGSSDPPGLDVTSA